MRLVHISTLIGALALGAAVTLYLRVERLERDLRGGRSAPREDGRAAEVADQAGERLPAVSPGVEPETATGLAAPLAQGHGRAVGGGTESGRATLEERVAQLERDQKVLKGHGAPWEPGRWGLQAPVRDIDDLSRRLSLTPTQKTRIEDVIARGRQRIEDVLKIPDETGKSPSERREESRKKLEEAMKSRQPGGVVALAADMLTYRNRKIPGRNETYGDEIGRIRKETREEMATALDGKQRETLDQTNVDGLLGDSGQVSFAYAIGDTGGEEGMIVEMGSEIVTDEPPPPEPPAGGGR